MSTHVELRPGAYHDSVSLMQVSRAVAGTPGVVAAQVAMATELNVDVLRSMGFDVPDEAGPNDLVIALRTDTPDAVAPGLAAVADALAGLRATRDTGGGDEAVAPRTLGSAASRAAATLAVISVPGQHAVTEAFDAIASGLSVMLFSDNVSVEDEVALKDAAAAADVLVMGPDCGTAHIGGVALGFANVVRPGSVGIVAASGTGAQQVMCLLDAAGVGVSHCLGVGGRDLKAAVGGRSTRQALEALADDPATESVVVVSKPPDAEVLGEVEAQATALGLRVHWAVLGAGRPDLTASVEQFLRAQGHAVPTWPTWPSWPSTAGDPGDGGLTRGAALRGLFCGGTLADEAMTVAEAELGGIRSNIAHDPALALGPDLRDDGHVIIDFGDDGLTRGRAHPMIDPTLRLERIAAEAADPTCGVLLLDLVLGHGSHPDPAGELADAVRAARSTARAGGRDLPVVVSLTGTDADPQGRARCAQLLAEAGATVHLSNAAATCAALTLLRSA
jgi:FdrA protein